MKTSATKGSLSLIEVVRSASQAILEVYTSDFRVKVKGDTSPLTLADTRSHEILTAYLRDQYPFPVLSEEGKDIPYEERKTWKTFWLLDPLDGTKEFVNKNGEFTINIALIHEGRPVIGIIYVPVTGVLYYAAKRQGAYKIEGRKTERLFRKKNLPELTVVGSRSHVTQEFDEYVQALVKKHGELKFITAGSSLKFCLVAEGRAAIYPRFGPTMEWDTAAGQVIVEEAGGRVLEAVSGKPLQYNKDNLLNPNFIAYRGDGHA